MVYRSAKTRVWDSWVLPYGGKYHLFHLETPYTDGYNIDDWGYKTIGRAVSDDMVHWIPLPSIPVISDEPDAWNNSIAFTGTTVEHDGKFYLFITCPDSTGGSKIGCFVSDDLSDWKRVSKNAQLVVSPPYFTGNDSYVPDWRDIDIIKGEDGYFHGFVTAKMGEISCDSTGSVIAHVRSQNLLDWEYLPPVFDGREKFRHTEVPGICRWGEWYYLTFNTTSLGGMRINTPTRDETGGTYYMRSHNIDGPYGMDDEPMLAGGCSTVLSDYSGRIVKRGNDYVLWHEITSRLSAFNSPKLLRQTEDGWLTVHYDPMTDSLKERALEPVYFCKDGGRWSHNGGSITGGAKVKTTVCSLCDDIRDGMLTVNVLPGSSSRCGVVVHGDREETGLGFLLDTERGLLTLGRCEYEATLSARTTDKAFEYYIRSDMVIRRSLKSSQNYMLRVLFRDAYIECYLDDEYLFSWGTERLWWRRHTDEHQYSETGALQLFVERGDAVFSDIQLHTFAPLPRAR